MLLTTPLLGSLLSLSAVAVAVAVADPTWPSANDELEEIMYQVSGFNSRGFGGTVIPCSNEASGPGRQNAAEWLRTGFHDMATANINFGTGGLDGSLQYELNSGENTGPGFATTLKFMNDYYTSRSSVADLIALGVYYSVRSCGGPAISVRGGRKDATGAGSIGVPQPIDSLFSFQQQFLRMGFNNTEMIQAVACGHAIGGVHQTEFPGLVPAGSTVNGEAGFDSTVAVLENKVVTEYISGNTTNPLVVGPSVASAQNSDGRIFGSDKNATVQAMANPVIFNQACKNIFEKMINVVPAGVTLTDAIQPYNVKPDKIQLTLQSGASTMALTGYIRVRVTVSPASSIQSLTLTYKDRNGGSNCGNAGCTYVSHIQGATQGFDDQFVWFPLNAVLSTSNGISSFTLTLNFNNGTQQVFDNNGVTYPVDDSILIQKPQSCLTQSTGALTVTAAVRNDRNGQPVNMVVSQKVAAGGPVYSLSSSTVAMTRGTCVGPYTFYTGTYTIPGNVSYSAKIDAISGTGSSAAGDYFKAASDLGGSCQNFDNPPSSLCTTGASLSTSSSTSLASTLVTASITSIITASSMISSTVSSSTGPIATLSHRQSMGGYRLVGCKTESTTPGRRALSAASFAYNGMTLETCMQNCTGYNYWATEYGRECYCGDSLDSTSQDADLAECNMVCSADSTEYCGAGNRIELYVTSAPQPSPTATLGVKPTVLPYTRLGCYTELSNGRALSGASYADDTMTLELCASKCSSFTYFAAEYGRECYCGNTLDPSSILASAGDCNMLCGGNKFEYCGGGSRLELYLKSTSLPVSASTLMQASSSLPVSSTTQISTSTSSTVSSSPSASSSSTSTSSVTISGTSIKPGSITSRTSTSINLASSPIITSTSTATTTSPQSSSISTVATNPGSSNITTSSATMTSLHHQPTVSTYSLIGCWTEANNGKRALSAASTSSGTSMTLETCASFCQAYHYFSTEYGGECYCGNSLDSTSNAAALSDCDMPCTGDKYQYCGSGGRLELYYSNVTHGPSQPPVVGGYSWYGCQTEVQGRALGAASYTSGDKMTLESCAGFCSGYKYFGTEYGDECYCGNSFSSTASVAAPESDCSMVCSGNSKEYCGAGNRLSVYSRSM